MSAGEWLEWLKMGDMFRAKVDGVKLSESVLESNLPSRTPYTLQSEIESEVWTSDQRLIATAFLAISLFPSDIVFSWSRSVTIVKPLSDVRKVLARMLRLALISLNVAKPLSV